MKVKINDTIGDLLYPITLDRPVYLLFDKGGTKIEDVTEILESILLQTTGEWLVSKFRNFKKEYYVEYI